MQYEFKIYTLIQFRGGTNSEEKNMHQFPIYFEQTQDKCKKLVLENKTLFGSFP